MDRNNQGLLLIAALLVAFSAFRVIQGTQPPAELLGIPAVVLDDVVALRFEGPGGILAASRSEGGWAITEPEALPADTRKVEALLGDWAGGFSADLEVKKNSSPDDDMRYGLDPEHRTVLELRGAAGPLVEIHLGRSIAGGSHYLRAPGSTYVYRGRVPGSSRLKPNIEAWEDRRLLPGSSPDLVRLEVRGSRGAIVFQRTSISEPWQSAADPESPVSDAKIDALARSLGKLTARSILRGGEAEAERGSAALDTPRLTIAAVDGAGSTTTVQLGSDHADKGFLYAALPGDPRLFVLPKSVLRNFDKDAAGLGGEPSASATTP
jgi:hypothetical protein